MTKGMEGGCACGGVRYRLEDDPMFVHCCHCASCQRETGTAFALNALIEAGRVTILSGMPERVLTPSDSGKGQMIWRCPSCRVALWSNYAGAGDAIRFVRVGTLDDRKAVAPDIHIYTRSKLPWVTLPDDVAAVEAFYDLKETWPPEARERFRAVRGGAGK